MKEHTQWHETTEVVEGEVIYITKHHTPDSYEIRNELSWLTSNMIRSCCTFQVPQVVEASIARGYIKMVKVENASECSPEMMLDPILRIASELHSVIQTAEPCFRNPASASEYIPYLKDYSQKKIKLVVGDVPIDQGVQERIMEAFEKIVTPYFSIVHRDLRYRHVLQQSGKSPVLIDWEFSNVSHFAQDLAKIVCDYAVQYDFDLEVVLERVVKTYSALVRLPSDLVLDATRAFLPVIFLEHSASFVQRKCKDYLVMAQKDVEYLSLCTKI